jgi:nicotinamide mononucleotide transporter
MGIQEIYQQFITGLQQTGPLEFIAVLAGIIGVWFGAKENVLVYPIGLINTIVYIYISLKGHLFGEASVNLYYTIMSIYGWILWTKKDKIKHENVLHITYSSGKEWLTQVAFFAFFYTVIFFSLRWLKNEFAPEAIPWADALASATAYTGMWLMAKKKMESWYWWLLTNIASIPLYFVKGYVFTSVQYFALLIINIFGFFAWAKSARENRISNIEQGMSNVE